MTNIDKSYRYIDQGLNLQQAVRRTIDSFAVREDVLFHAVLRIVQSRSVFGNIHGFLILNIQCQVIDIRSSSTYLESILS